MAQPPGDRHPAAAIRVASGRCTPRSRRPVRPEYLSLAWWLGGGLWCIQRGVQHRLPRNTRHIGRGGRPAGEGGHDNGKPGESRGRKALEATAGPGRPARHARPAAERSLGEGLVMRPADGHADHTEPQNPAPSAGRVAGQPPGRPPIRPSVPPTQAAERFAAALRAAAATGATNAGPLREAVRAYVETRRDAGDPPERALIAVKERVGDALRRRPSTPKRDASTLLRRVVHWAIEAYYRAD